jgi:hypothetical protein
MTTLLLGLITGIGFGFALQRAGFKRPNIVQRGLWFKDFTMLKLMLTAIVVGLVGMYLLSAIEPSWVHFKVKPLYLWGVLGGGLLFGVGIALAGYCPGTAIVGLASGRGEGAMAVLGGLVGALAFTFAYPALKPVLMDPANFGPLTIPSVLGLPPLPTALAFAALLVAVIWGLSRHGGQPGRAEAGPRP